VTVEAFVKVSGADREFVLRTRDLSETGLFLYTKVAHIYPFRVGSTLTLELHDYDASVSCEVVVARVVEAGSAEADDYPTGFGVKITRIAPEKRAHLSSMIKRIRESGALY
jgi:hypothetical protein